MKMMMFKGVCPKKCSKQKNMDRRFIIYYHLEAFFFYPKFLRNAKKQRATRLEGIATTTTTTTTTMAMRAPFSSVPSRSSSLSSKGKNGTSTSRGRRQKCVKIVFSSSASTATTESSSSSLTKLQGKDTKARTLAVPYNDGNKDCDIFINEHAKQKITDRNCSKFVSLIDAENPKLKTLLNIIERDWDRIGVKNKNAGPHTLWPEAFEAGKALLEECFPEECSPEFGGEVLNGVGFVNEPEFQKTRAIDFMQRRPKGDFTHCKYNPLPRLHRDPDAIDYKSPNWRETAMENSEEYSYRYYNVWISRTPKDPTGQVWDNPLLILLPKDGGAKEWKYDIVTEKDNLDENGNEIKPPSAFEQIKSNPMAAAPLVMKMFSAKKGKEFRDDATDPDYFARGSPELIADDEHEFVTGPFVAFDSFDCWHGSGKWDSEAKKSLIDGSKNPMEARAEAAKGRISMELRFRARCKPNNREGLLWSPVSSAYRSNTFTDVSVRPSEQAYDLVSGKAL